MRKGSGDNKDSNNEPRSAQKSWSCDLRCALQSSLARRNTQWERLAARIIGLCRKSLSGCVATVSGSRRRNRIVPGQRRSRNRIVNQSDAVVGKVRSKNCRRKRSAQSGKLRRRNPSRARKDRSSQAGIPGNSSRHCRRNRQEDERRRWEQEEEKSNCQETKTEDERGQQQEEDEEMLQVEESLRWAFNDDESATTYEEEEDSI
jgi:hypothetical protein